MCIYISMYIDLGTHTQVQVCVDYIYYIYKANFQSSENKSYPHITAKFLHNSISTSHLVWTALIPSVNPSALCNDIL